MAAKKRDGLTPREQAFVAEYLLDLNQGLAAKRMGERFGIRYAHPEVIGSKMMDKAEVRAGIQAGMDRRAKRTEITADKVLNEIAHMGFANMLDYISTQGDGSAFVDLSKLTREQAAAIQEVTVDAYTEGKGEEAREVKRIKFKLHDKRGSLELLGKHLKLFTEKHEIGFTKLEDLTDDQLAMLASRLNIPVVSIASGRRA